MNKALSILIVFMSSISLATTYDNSVYSTKAEITSTYYFQPGHFAAFLGTSRISIDPVSYGASVDYQISDLFAVSFGVFHTTKKDAETYFGGRHLEIDSSQFIGSKTFLPIPGVHGLFIPAGYKYGRNTFDDQPSLLGGPSAQIGQNYGGAYIGIGYRLQQQINWGRLILDISAAYTPGHVKDSTYVADEVNLINVTKGHVQANLGYEIEPNLQIGLQF